MSSPPRDSKSVLVSLGLGEHAHAILHGEARLVIFAMTSHLDWDWVLPFPILLAGPGDSSDSAATAYFNPPANAPASQVLAQAATQLGADPDYRYMIVEMGFLRAFAGTDPASFAQLVAAGDRLHLCGAGVTSPDSLLPHVEAFLRNYLLGRLWAESALPGATISQCYLPDDFGHDPELPATLAAMGMAGVAFARLPGEWAVSQNPIGPTGLDGKPTQAATLFAGREIDFVWAASDGSTVLAHWMPEWYSGVGIPDAPSTESILTALETAHGTGIQPPTLIGASPRPYSYSGLGNDFRLPITGLPGVIAEWNAKPPAVDHVKQTVYCAQGSFDDFVILASATGKLKTLGEGAPEPMYSTPYYVGCQATRPALKILHQRAVRALLAAETFGAADVARGSTASDPAAVTGQAPADLLAEAWGLLVPSTHHDYINGTAHPNVYRSEQLPLLRAAVDRAEWLRDDALAGIAGRLPPPHGSNRSVAVFNATGFDRTVLAECDRGALGDHDAATGNGVTSVVQDSAEGRALFVATVPPQGYAVMTGTRDTVPGPSHPAKAAPGGGTVTLANGLLEVVLSPDGGWGISSIVDVASGAEVVTPGAVANALAIYADGGNEYVLGAEKTDGLFEEKTPTLTPGAVEVLESGPLRARVRATFTCPTPGGGPTLTFVREYALHCGEAILRMSLTGRAPYGTSVLVKFPLGPSKTAIDAVTRGTAAHWTAQMPQLLWSGPTTYASHHFAIASSGGQPLAAMLHADVPAWGLWGDDKGNSGADGTLYGVMLRNPTGDYFTFGWSRPNGPFPGGTDPDVHTRCYALLAPSQCDLSPPVEALRQGMHFATAPLVAPLSEYLTEPAPGTLPQTLSIAGAASPALVTAVKLGARDADTLVLRLYHPAPSGATSAVTVDANTVPGWAEGTPIGATLLTALEEPLGAISGVTVDGATATVPVPVSRAITTLGLKAEASAA